MRIGLCLYLMLPWIVNSLVWYRDEWKCESRRKTNRSAQPNVSLAKAIAVCLSS